MGYSGPPSELHAQAEDLERRQRREPIPRTAPGRPLEPRTGATAPEPVSSGPEPSPPTENASAGQQSASQFEATVGGEVYRKPEDAALALTLLIEQSSAPGQIFEEYDAVFEVLPDKLANEVLDAVSARNNALERKRAAAERERQAAAKTDRKQEPKRRGRPSEAFKRVLAAINSATSRREIDGVLKSDAYRSLSATDKAWIDRRS